LGMAKPRYLEVLNLEVEILESVRRSSIDDSDPVEPQNEKAFIRLLKSFGTSLGVSTCQSSILRGSFSGPCKR
jgi:hypothetical protein